MTTSHQEFDYSSISGALTPEQAIQALAMGEGDTSTKLEHGGAPATTTATEANSAAGADDNGKTAATANTSKDAGATTEAEDPAQAVVLARDGKHHIPYETLEKHRQGEQHWKAQAEAAQQQLAELQAQAQARVDAGQAATKTDQMAAKAAAAIEAGADADLFGDFSEEALKGGLLKLNQQMRDELRAELREEIKKELAPLREKHANSEAQSHYEAIYGKHPDADSIAQSNEFKAWVDTHPSAVRNAYWALFDAQTGGTAKEIVEVFDAFKAAGTQKTAPTAAASKAAASAAVASTKNEPPASLSSIPGGHAAGASVMDRMADMSGPEQLAATQHMTPEQIEAWLNRTV